MVSAFLAGLFELACVAIGLHFGGLEGLGLPTLTEGGVLLAGRSQNLLSIDVLTTKLLALVENFSKILTFVNDGQHEVAVSHILLYEPDPSHHQDRHLCHQEELQHPHPRQQVPPILALPRVSFVIPTLNEEKNLPYLMPRLPEWACEVIIVDGRSTDRTVEVARQLRPDVIIVMEPKPGKGAALRAGFKAAGGDVIVMLDADGSMAPEESIVFLSALMIGADLVKGSRSLQGSGSTDLSFVRALGNWGLTQAVRWLFWCSFSDLCYGYIAFWARHVHLFDTCDGFEIETLINLRAVKHQLKIVEVASFESSRIHGVSNLRAIRDGTRILRTILRERLRSRRPSHGSVRPFRINLGQEP